MTAVADQQRALGGAKKMDLVKVVAVVVVGVDLEAKVLGVKVPICTVTPFLCLINRNLMNGQLEKADLNFCDCQPLEAFFMLNENKLLTSMSLFP